MQRLWRHLPAMPPAASALLKPTCCAKRFLSRTPVLLRCRRRCLLWKRSCSGGAAWWR